MASPDYPPIPPDLHAHLTSLSNPPRPSSYTQTLHSLLNPPHPNLSHFITFLYTPTLALQPARTLFDTTIQALITLPEDIFTPLSAHILTLHRTITARAFAFEHNLILLRERVSQIAEHNARYVHAADVLAEISPDALAGMPEIAVRLHCRAASLYIHAGLIDKADIYTNRASALVPQLENEQLKLVHRHVQASLLDRKNRFEDAASKYYALSRAAADMAPLTNALTCAILAPAGPRRSRMLAILYNDERARRLELFSLLERLHMGRILRQEQIDRFRPTLKKHQLVRLADGDTVLDRAVMEHNLLAVSRLYANIGFVELGTLLCVDKRKAETIAARMIYEGRMKATVDQVDGVLRFGGQAEKIERWDSHIASLCMAVDDCVDAIVDKFPQFATHLES